ncbi:MAG TPA: CHASE3 domain-containing protein [Verrucomicrobiae bacterium]|nr:CHASE3 domain-containing protein [Verrucomicrobiae bacterium]
MTFKHKLTAGFGSALVVLVLVGSLAYRSILKGEEDRQWVMHTHEVLETLDDVLTNLLDVESGVRGYILTGEKSLLSPYAAAVGQVAQNMKKVRTLTADNPVQQKSLDLLEPLIAKRLQRAEFMIDLRSREGLAAAADPPQLGMGKELVDQIRNKLGIMKDEEDRLLALRVLAANSSSRDTRILIVAGNTIAVIFCLAAGLVIAQELKQRRHAEETVLKLNADLERRVEERTAELATQAKDLARSNSELQQFAYVASHDLQEPLRMVASFTQLLAKRYAGQLDDDARDFINFAVDGATRMQTLISDLLNYSRVGTQGKPLAPTDSEGVFLKVLESLRFAIEENHATITHDPLPMVQADWLQLAQLFQNLLTNAIKFHGEAPPQIHVSAHDMGNNWKFSIRDNGIGIAQEHADRIFVIFQRLHTKIEYPGTGIGLAICKKIVERHGGRIWVEPTAGTGTTFSFTMASAGKAAEGRESNELHVAAYAN